MTDDIVQAELDQIVQAIPDIWWIRFIHFDGIDHSKYRFDAGIFQRNTPLDREEDRCAPISVAALSLGERVLHELVLGAPRFTAIVGENATHFLLPIGDGEEWFLAFAVKGHPPVDTIIRYFADRHNLAHLVPLL